MDARGIMERPAILVVEDAEDCVATLEVALAPFIGYAISIARTAEEALLTLECVRVAAIVTDIHLPSMDGLELLALLREDPRHAGLPVLVTSADPDPGLPQRALQLGAAAFFPKPYSPSAIRKKLEELLDVHC